MAKSVGKEEKLFQKLVEKYGPEPEAAKPEKAAKAAVANSVAAAADEDNKVDEDEAGGDDDYGARGWWRSRLVRFYAKYASEKTGEDIDKLLDKAGTPNALNKMFVMLEKKYGPEPDPSSSEEEEEEAAEEEESEEEEEEDIVLPGLRNVVYCPVDGVPPELSEYYDTFAQALPWLAGNKPDLKLSTKGGVSASEYAKAQGVEPLQAGIKVQALAQERKRGVGGKKGDGKIIIESQERRRKMITTVKGLEQVEGVILKEAAKKLGKKFASGAAVKDSPGGGDMIEIQGDAAFELPDVLLEFFPGVKKADIFVISEDGKKRNAFD